MTTTPAILIAIADGVVDAMNNADWSLPFEAQRSYMARHDLEELGVLRVDVVPGVVLQELQTRATTLDEYRVDIAVRKRFEFEEGNPFIDPLAGLTQEIADHFRFSRLAEFRATWRRSDIDPLFVPLHLETWRQYTGIVRLTYRLQR